MSVDLSEQKYDSGGSAYSFQSSKLLESSFSGSDENKSLLSKTSVANSSYTTQTSLSVSTKRKASGRSKLQGPNPLKRLTSSKSSHDLPALDFGCAGLVGRDNEIATLKSCYHRLVKGGNKELVFVAGQSGSGKSSVVLKSMETEISGEGLFVEGKFDMNTSHEPYSGVAKAFGIMCIKVKEAGPETIADLRQELTRDLGDKPSLLLQLIPELKGILMVGEASDCVVGSIDRVDESEGGVDRLRFAFRVLARVFSSFFSPLVIFLDDLQWSDVASLQVLEFLVSDTENEEPLMIIGSYRSEETDENSLLYNKLVSLREKTERFQFLITEIVVGSFSPSDIEKVITEVLPSLRADHIVGLAALCHKRTLGNPFFTIEFLRMLHFEGLLKFDTGTKAWSWDLSEIEEQTMSTANVVVMLEQHLRKLPEQVQALLQCAAYLGSTFSEPTIDLVWSVYGRRIVDTKIEPVSSLLPLIVADNILEKSEGNNEYRWCHDKLQEAALSLSGTLRETFQLDIGKALYYGLPKDQVETDLFTIVDLINSGNVSMLQEYAGVNLRAAEKAREISAFQSAADYANEGIRLLKESDWVHNTSTALSLYSIGSEAELILGNVETAASYREVVLLHSDSLSALEILPLQIGKIKALGEVELKHKEAQEYCLKLLKIQGCRLTWFRPLSLPQAVIKFIRTLKKAKAKPASFFESLEASQDHKKKFVGYLLIKLATHSYYVGDEAMYVLATIKLVELTMEHGANEFAATSFCFFAVLCVIVLQDYEAMERFQNVALGMLKKFRGMHTAETLSNTLNLCILWVKPLEIGRKMIGEAILGGRREGDSFFTSWLVSFDVAFLPYTTGRPILSILEKCPNALAEFEDIKTTVHVLLMKTYYQMFLNLSDPSCGDPNKLTGTIYSDTEDMHKGNNLHLSDRLVAEGELIFWHEDYEVAARRALQVGDLYAKLAPALFLHQIESFHRAVALYAAAIKTKKRKYKIAANKIRKNIGKLTKYGNTTIHYYHMFLSAEKLSLDNRSSEAKVKYEQALKAVGNLGHLHHLGLFNERYSDFLRRHLSLEKEAIHHLDEAIRYYKEWGVVHKVKALESRLETKDQ